MDLLRRRCLVIGVYWSNKRFEMLVFLCWLFPPFSLGVRAPEPVIGFCLLLVATQSGAIVGFIYSFLFRLPSISRTSSHVFSPVIFRPPTPPQIPSSSLISPHKCPNRREEGQMRWLLGFCVYSADSVGIS